MKHVTIKRGLCVAFTVASALLFTYCWHNNTSTVVFSEALWSFYNQIFDGQKPGLASDLELLTVFLGFLMITGGIAGALLRWLGDSRKKQRNT